MAKFRNMLLDNRNDLLFFQVETPLLHFVVFNLAALSNDDILKHSCELIDKMEKKLNIYKNKASPLLLHTCIEYVISFYLITSAENEISLMLTKLFWKRSHLENITVLDVSTQWDAIGVWKQERNVKATCVKSIHRRRVSLLTMAAAGHDWNMCMQKLLHREISLELKFNYGVDRFADALGQHCRFSRACFSIYINTPDVTWEEKNTIFITRHSFFSFDYASLWKKKCIIRKAVFAHTLNKSGAVLRDFYQHGIPLISSYCVHICCQQIVVDRAVGVELTFHLLAFIRLTIKLLHTQPSLLKTHSAKHWLHLNGNVIYH